MDDTERYAYGHSAKGKRCYAEKPGKKSIAASHGVLSTG
ncbi:hypothetical protein Psal071_03055 [Piscirickettsia salmonis]|uniref:Uncharacterized protein n=1 Tax=Piscirickettsia salmonis TaxID=1238 RepID=A0A9Q6LM34_PISSA|nr:hypothetical protein Psal006a_03054 [Piscirickettsia salmonis]QGO07357.1 hypothetical protein Psal009_03303 [Piscirickettsia salmonis]QGO35685.1 hypothetical protein Psal028_03056 [Piscirickettsia salmonis]QGO39303.1 hypothetical protein Psal040_03064 [Piscirickettsia salmonis]QGO42917.1 hypothetical protein Psal041_03052 [Piscirickettsia salmonis]